MNTVAIIQARMGSSRLPGKVLMDLEGGTVLARVVRRLGRSRANQQRSSWPRLDEAADDAIVDGMRAFAEFVFSRFGAGCFGSLLSGRACECR